MDMVTVVMRDGRRRTVLAALREAELRIEAAGSVRYWWSNPGEFGALWQVRSLSCPGYSREVRAAVVRAQLEAASLRRSLVAS